MENSDFNDDVFLRMLKEELEAANQEVQALKLLILKREQRKAPRSFATKQTDAFLLGEEANGKCKDENKELSLGFGEEGDYEPMQEQIIKIIEEAGRFLHISEIMSKINRPSSSVTSKISKMVKKGELTRVKYNNSFAYIFYGLNDFVHKVDGKTDFKDISFESTGEKTRGVNRRTKNFAK